MPQCATGSLSRDGPRGPVRAGALPLPSRPLGAGQPRPLAAGGDGESGAAADRPRAGVPAPRGERGSHVTRAQHPSVTCRGGCGHVGAGGHGGSAAAAAALGRVAAAGERAGGAGRGRRARGGPGLGWAGLTLSLCCQVSAAAAVGTFPKRVKVVEVGPRDGLQNEKVRAGLGASPGGSLST